MKELPLYLLLVVIGYLLGSIPTGQIVGALAGGVDLRRYGSGKTGATNVLRTLGWGAALVVVAGDLAKGIVAVLIARWLVPAAGGSTGFLPDSNAQPIAEVLAGFAAVIGHNWSIFIQLRGGRGVVVSHAVFILICWPAALITTVIGAIVLAVSRIVSLASLTGAVAGVLVLAIFVVLFHYPLPYLVYGVLAAGLIWLRHIDNIQRLLAGTERKLGQKAQPLP
jgi:acyl phosphate:glycerol-3-phosphate acyltransferase